MPIKLTAGRPNHLGARFDGEGTNFAVFSANASQVYLAMFSEDGTIETDRVALPERTGHVWHGYAPGLKPGSLYGYRVDGVYAPEQGHRFNVNKLLMDPYAREMHGPWIDGTVLTADTIDLPIKTSGEFLSIYSKFGNDDPRLLSNDVPYERVLELATPSEKAVLTGLSD